MATSSEVDDYIARAPEFARPILAELRARVHAACPDAGEAIKWRMPFFLYRGRPLANMAAHKAHASFGFWSREADMAKADEGMGQFGRLMSVADLPAAADMAAAIRAAMAVIDSAAPSRPARAPKPEAAVPSALAEALAKDEAARATFDGFPPSCRREYCAWIAEAKRPETVARRVAQAIEQMREGKRHNWQHMRG